MIFLVDNYDFALGGKNKTSSTGTENRELCRSNPIFVLVGSVAPEEKKYDFFFLLIFMKTMSSYL
jgi:hypothetical protein